MSQPIPNSRRDGKAVAGLIWAELEGGAQGRNRTTDTAIFSRMLYQLSYLGDPEPAIAFAAGFTGPLGVRAL